jgi:hypothetical protein
MWEMLGFVTCLVIHERGIGFFGASLPHFGLWFPL